MTHARFGIVAAVVAAVALGGPAVASANEVTKWNDIAVSTVNAQPAVGVTAAEAMLAEGHDGRTVINCGFGSPSQPMR